MASKASYSSERERVMTAQRFEDLTIWKSSMSLTKTIYDFTRKPEFARDFGLSNQIQRSIVSVSSNIVEGFEKNNINEFARYLKIAKGSVGEARSQLYTAHVVGYITNQELSQANMQLEQLGHQIGAFISYLRKVQQNRKR